MLLVIIRGSTKVDYLDGVVQWPHPNSLLLRAFGQLLAASATVLQVVALLLIRKLFDFGAIVHRALVLHVDWVPLVLLAPLSRVHLEENVLWLQISMSQPDFFVEEANALQDLPPDRLDVAQSKPVILIRLDELV